jgi:hypothetical protein
MTSQSVLSLGERHRVLVLLGDHAEYMGIPVEMLVPEWAAQLGDPLPTLMDYAQDWFDWLPTAETYLPSDQRSSGFVSALDDVYLDIRASMIKQLESTETGAPPGSDRDSEAITNAIDEVLGAIRVRDIRAGSPQVPPAAYIQGLHDEIRASFEWVFDDVSHTEAGDAALLKEVPLAVAGHGQMEPGDPLLGMAGYGDTQVFPAVVVMDDLPVFNGMCFCSVTGESHIDQQVNSGIHTIGAASAVHTFLRGYDAAFVIEAEEGLAGLAQVRRGMRRP